MNKKFGLFAFLWIFATYVALLAQTSTGRVYIYDEARQLVGVIDEDGTRLAYTYDAAGNLVSIERLEPRGAVDIFFLEPSSGSVGAPVTIHGVGFSPVPAENQVTFNGARAVVLSSTATTITTRVPVGASTGPVRVTAPAGMATSRSDFTLVRSPESECVNTTAGLVSWWPAEGNARDIVGANHGTLQGGVTFAPGRVGEAFRFNGTDGFVQFPPINLFTRTFSIDFWMFPTRSAANQNLVSNARNAGTFFGELWLNGDHLEYRRDAGGGVGTPGGSIRLNVWSHVALTYDGLVVRIYINGAVAATSDVHDEIFNNALRLGNSFLQDVNFFGGLLDEVELYNRALSVSEVRAIFDAGSNGKCKQLHMLTTQLPDNAVGQPSSHQLEARFGDPPLTFSFVTGNLPPGMTLSSSGVLSGIPTTAGTFSFTVAVTDAAGAGASGTISKNVGACASPSSGLVSWWPGDGNANDLVSGNQGTLRNGVTFIPGKVGLAFNFNGVNQYVDLPAINMASRTFAIDFWMFPTRSAGNQNLVSNARNTGNFGELWLNGDHLEYQQGSSGSVNTPAGSIRLNAWSHVALTYDGLVVRIYINGAVAAASGVHDEIFNNALRLGNSFLQDVNFFGGLLDEVELFNRALTTDEVQAIFTAGSVGKCKRLHIVTTQLPDNAVGQPASHQIETRLGVAPVAFSLVSGDLPTGMALSPSGVLSGIPTAAGAFNFTVQVTDSNGAVATRAIRKSVGACAPTVSGLVSWWPGDGDANDLISGNQGTLRNGATFAAGQVGPAFSLNGTNQFVDLPAINMASRTFSIDFWMFPTRSAGNQNLVSNARNAGTFGELWLNGDHLEYRRDGGGGVGTPGGSTRLNVWSHVALTYDGLVVRIYINGDVAATSSVHDEIFNNALRLGNSFLQDGNFFGGLLDEVELYNRALTTDEVQAIFNASSVGKCKRLHIVTTQLPDNAVGQPASHQIETRFGVVPVAFSLVSGDLPTGMALSPSGVLSGTPSAEGTFTFTVQVTDASNAVSTKDISKNVGACAPTVSGLVSWWPGDGNANDVISTNHGTLVNGATFAPGKVGRAFSFNGVNQYVNLPSINMASRTFSIDFWMFPTRSASNQNLVSNARNTGNFGELWLNGNHLEYQQGSGGGVSTPTEPPERRIPLNAWSHVALTYDGLVVRIYINGDVAATSGVHDEIFSNALRLGNSLLEDGNVFGGLLDEVELYNRALTADEIQAIFAADSVGKCKRLHIVTTQLPDNVVDQPASHQIETRFGVAPLAFTLISGNLPTGMALSASGVLSGTSSEKGTFTFTVQVTDAGGAVATGPINKNVGACLPTVSGLVSWWPGDGNANDIIAGNHGTLQGGVTFAPGKVGPAFSFNAVDGFVQLPSINVGRTFSIDFWMFPTRSAGNQNVVSNARNTGNFGELWLNGDHLEYQQGSGGSVSTGSGSIRLNAWSHVALTYDRSVVRIYINGTLAASGGAHDEVFNNALRLSYSFLQDTNLFGGLLDEVTLYNRALSADEIQAIFAVDNIGKCKPLYIVTTQLPDTVVNQPASHQIETRFGIPPLTFELVSGDLPPGMTLDENGVVSGTPTAAGTFSFTVQVTDDEGATATGIIRLRVVACVPTVSGLVSWWPGEGNADDLIGGNNGTLQGGVTFAPGKVGQAFSFNGVAAYVEVPHNASLDFAFPRDFTLEAWINWLNVDLFDQRTIISKRSPDNANVTYQFHMELNTGRMRLTTRSGGGGFTGVSSAPFSWLPNTWYHVAVTVTGNDVTFYRDGQVMGTGTLPIARPSTTGKFTIGAALAGTSDVFNPWKGQLDEISIYNRALSASDIQAIFSAGSAGKCRP